MPKVFIGVGSNLGDREGHFEFARKELLLVAGLRDLRASPVYETEPVGAEGGPFLNAVWSFETELPPRALLKQLQKIEAKAGRPKIKRASLADSQAGRERNRSHEARTLDLDLLFYGDQMIRETGLVVPHPRLHERAFVLKPMADLAPDFVHPLFKKTMKDLLEKLKALK